MNQCESLRCVSLWASFQPSQAFFADACQRRRNQVLNDREKGSKLRRLGRKFRQALSRPKHLIRIPAHSRPPQRANLIDYLGRVRPAVSQIPAMDNQIRRDLPQVSQHSLKRPKVPMNIRYDRDSHSAPHRFDFFTDELDAGSAP
jgi:hypothetical protein